MRKTFKKAAAVLATLTLALSLVSGVAPMTASAANDPTASAIKDGKAKFDGSGNKEYHAYFLYQSSNTWTFRNAYFDKKLGKETKFWAKMNTKGKGNQVASTKVVDATIKGNGTFTVGVSGLNGLCDKDDPINILGFSTDIPSSAKKQIKISNISITEDGAWKTTVKEAFFDPDSIDAPKTLTVLTNNKWNKDLTAQAMELTPPHDAISLTFTVSGFAKDDPNGKPTAAPKATSSSTTSDSSSSSGLPVPAIVGIICAAVVVVVVVVVAVKKKKK
jgi:hypothetical protein